MAHLTGYTCERYFIYRLYIHYRILRVGVTLKYYFRPFLQPFDPFNKTLPTSAGGPHAATSNFASISIHLIVQPYLAIFQSVFLIWKAPAYLESPLQEWIPKQSHLHYQLRSQIRRKTSQNDPPDIDTIDCKLCTYTDVK